MNYTKEELERLHLCLYDILKEIRRVCDLLNIRFVMLGGSAIGVYYWKGIIPFDDDIDIGMERRDYEKFLAEAPRLLQEQYFLQWQKTERHYPLFFAKVRRNDTMYVEEPYLDMDIHQGVFVDIMPLDHIPDNSFSRYIQRKLAVLTNECLVSKEIWRYKWFGKCEIKSPAKASWPSCLIYKFARTFLSKAFIYKLLLSIQTFYDNKTTQYSNTIPPYCDLMPNTDLLNLAVVEFGDTHVWVPDHLDNYLHRHYPSLKKDLTEEEIQAYSHRPVKLKLPE